MRLASDGEDFCGFAEAEEAGANQELQAEASAF